VDKDIPARIDADMTGKVPGFEKHQIAFPQIAAGYFFPRLRLIFCAAWHGNTE
jgi:hypothetical protein